VPVPQTGPEILMAVVAAAILVPIGEEVFFRGYTMTAWLRDLGPRSALIRATVFFALIHVLNITTETFGEGLAQAILQIAVITPVGLALGWLYLRRGLIAAIAGHAAFNLLGVLILVLAQNLPAPGIGA
jgi:membrane protease YdiL (CAAX protease family)